MACIICDKKLTYGEILQGNYRIVNGIAHSVHKKCLEEYHKCSANMELHKKSECPMLKGFKEVIV